MLLTLWVKAELIAAVIVPAAYAIFFAYKNFR